MVMREASNGGASGRVCADTATRFPARKTSAANEKLLSTKISRSSQSSEGFDRLIMRTQARHISTPFARTFQTKNASGSIVEQRLFRRTLYSSYRFRI